MWGIKDKYMHSSFHIKMTNLGLAAIMIVIIAIMCSSSCQWNWEVLEWTIPRSFSHKTSPKPSVAVPDWADMPTLLWIWSCAHPTSFLTCWNIIFYVNHLVLLSLQFKMVSSQKPTAFSTESIFVPLPPWLVRAGPDSPVTPIHNGNLLVSGSVLSKQFSSSLTKLLKILVHMLLFISCMWYIKRKYIWRRENAYTYSLITFISFLFFFLFFYKYKLGPVSRP